MTCNKYLIVWNANPHELRQTLDHMCFVFSHLSFFRRLVNPSSSRGRTVTTGWTNGLRRRGTSEPASRLSVVCKHPFLTVGPCTIMVYGENTKAISWFLDAWRSHPLVLALHALAHLRSPSPPPKGTWIRGPTDGGDEQHTDIPKFAGSLCTVAAIEPWNMKVEGEGLGWGLRPFFVHDTRFSYDFAKWEHAITPK